jgi:hypothetical protein
MQQTGTKAEVKSFNKPMKQGLFRRHDAWVVGHESVVVVDFQGMLDYAKA